MSTKLYNCDHPMDEEKPGPCSWCWNNYKTSAIALQAERDELLELVKEFNKEAEFLKAFIGDGISGTLHPNDFKPLTSKLILKASELIAKAESKS